jgi:hypothetical protein
MPKFSMTVPHKLSQDEAIRRIHGLLADLKARHADRITDLQESWTDHEGRFSLTAMGFKVAGTLAVTSTTVELSGDLPFAAVPFKSRIEQMLREDAERLLA